MLRALIEDRFQMKYHWENRPVTAYHLVAVSPKLTPADPKARTRCEKVPGPDGKDPRLTNPMLNRLVTCQNITMAQFGVLLQSLAADYIYSPVLDDTGLKGSYNFTLSFSSISLIGALGGGGPSPDGAHQPSEPNGAISLFDRHRKSARAQAGEGKTPSTRAGHRPYRGAANGKLRLERPRNRCCCRLRDGNYTGYFEVWWTYRRVESVVSRSRS